MTKKLILIDLGNTLVDYHSGGLSDAEKDLVGLHRMHAYLLGAVRGRVTYSSLYDKFYQPWLRAQSHRANKLKEYDIKHFLLRVGPLRRLSDHQYKNALLKLHSPYIQYCRAATGADATLRQLRKRGIIVGLVANTPVPGFCHDAALSALGLLRWFNFRLYSYDIGIRKPHPKFFQLALEFGMTTAEFSLLIGDSERLDLTPAQKLGIRTIKFECRESSTRRSQDEKFSRMKRFEQIFDFLS